MVLSYLDSSVNMEFDRPWNTGKFGLFEFETTQDGSRRGTQDISHENSMSSDGIDMAQWH